MSVQVNVHVKTTDGKLFQYILCVGSSNGFEVLQRQQLSFNTSYVSVQDVTKLKMSGDDEFQYILCVGSRNKFSISCIVLCLFQYILCVGSSSSF